MIAPPRNNRQWPDSRLRGNDGILLYNAGMLGMGRKSVVWVLGGIVAAALIVAGIWRYGITAFAFVMHHYQVFVSLGALATAGGVIFAAWTAKSAVQSAKNSARNAEIAAGQSRIANRLMSVNFATQALKEFAADGIMQEAFYEAEYNRFEYPGHDGGPGERKIDRLLRHFAAVALAWEKGLVDPGDLVLIRYYVLKTMRNDNVMLYVNTVCEYWAQEAWRIEHPYTVLKKFHRDLEESSDSSDSAGTAR